MSTTSEYNSDSAESATDRKRRHWRERQRRYYAKTKEVAQRDPPLAAPLEEGDETLVQRAPTAEAAATRLARSRERSRLYQARKRAERRAAEEAAGVVKPVPYNPERIREYQTRYYQANREKLIARAKDAYRARKID